ncbi:MAG: Uncharacterised protein [Porticoccaceae bacterium UBA1117]|nr:MAG: Uncharacterised protein [Porticoccaceae bacterium UBA1117]
MFLDWLDSSRTLYYLDSLQCSADVPQSPHADGQLSLTDALSLRTPLDGSVISLWLYDKILWLIQ